MDVTNKFKTNSLNVENVLDFTLMVQFLKFLHRQKLLSPLVERFLVVSVLNIFTSSDIKLG